VFDNIALPLRLAKNKDCNMVSEALCFVHLESKIHHYPAQLSGKAMLSNTIRFPNKLKFWKTTPISLRSERSALLDSDFKSV
ncbi:hypothetical protein PT113_09340, partial [Erysipelothrix rhusiopathiae]|nr:hypothetical protein [Erysipelothrix rhusiopathiae]